MVQGSWGMGVGGGRVSSRVLELLGILQSPRETEAKREVPQLSLALQFGLGDQRDVALTFTAVTLFHHPASPGYSKEES